MSNPPTYEEALAQLDILKSKPLPLEVQQVAQKAMAEAVAKPQAADDLLAEVKDLADSVIKIDQAFERVKNDLGVVDKNEYKDDKGQPLAKLQPIWIGFQKRFIDLLWDSRSTATGTEAYVRDFIDVIIPEVESIKTDDDYKAAVADLKEFIGRKDPFGQKLNSSETTDAAQKHSQAFTDLRRDINAFKDSFDTFADAQKVAIGTQITDMTNEIIRLDLEIKKCDTIILAMGLALGVTVFATATGVVAALAAAGPLSPAFAVAIVIIGAIAAIGELSTLIAFIVKRNEYRSERDQDQRQLNDLNEQLKTLERLKTSLQAQKADIADICGRLDRFASIWALVAHDAALISADLKTAVDAAEGSGSKMAFQNRLQLIKSTYSALADGLKEYATQVDQSGIKKNPLVLLGGLKSEHHRRHKPSASHHNSLVDCD